MDALIENLPERKLVVRNSVHSEHAYAAATTHGADRCLERFDATHFDVPDICQLIFKLPLCLHPDSIDTNVSAAPVCHVANRLHRIVLFRVDRLRVCRAFSCGKTVIENIHANDAFGPAHPGALLRHQTHRTAAEYRDRFATSYARPVDAAITGRENIGEEQHFFIAEILRDLAWTEIRIRHSHVLRL